METIAFDFDDVICDITLAFLKFNQDYYGASIDFKKLGETFYESLGISSHEEDNRWNIFFKNNQYAYPCPDKNIVDYLLELKQKYNLILVTARKKIWQFQLKNWLNKYMKNIFDQIIFLDSSENQGKSKAQICMDNNCLLLIDDDPKHIDVCLKSKFKSILYNQPWNKNYKKNIIRINSILEIKPLIAKS